MKAEEKSFGSLSTELELLLIIHRACILSFIGAVVYSFYAVVVQKDFLNFLTSSPFIVIFLLEIILYKLRFMESLKILLTLGVPLLVSTETLIIGGDFSQSAGLMACLAVSFVFFSGNKKRLYFITILNISSYIAALLYIRFYGPLYEHKDDPYDEIVIFFLSTCWLFLIFNKHDWDKNHLIEHLERQNKSLLDATQELERFTNIASHDLKSPLRNISSFLGLIERQFKRGDTSELLTNLQYAQKGANQMYYLIEGILEVSKVNQAKKPHLEIVDLNQLLNNAVNNLRQDILEKKAQVTSETLPQYCCSPFEMTLLFQNLIQNAIKYNQSAQPKVEISAVEEAGFLKIAISDNGIGIDEQYHEYIFEHFKRLHGSAEYGGTGLGLSLCRKIVQKHGGDIVLQSSLGQGSTFAAVLPLGAKTN